MVSANVGIAYIGAAVGITVLLILGGLFHHKETHDVSIYRYPPPWYWFLYIVSFICAVLIIVILFLPRQDDLLPVEVALCPAFVVALVSAIYVRKARVVIDKDSITYFGLREHRIEFCEISAIATKGHSARDNRLLISTRSNKRLLISGLFEDFDQMVGELRGKCPQCNMQA